MKRDIFLTLLVPLPCLLVRRKGYVLLNIFASVLEICVYALLSSRGSVNFC